MNLMVILFFLLCCVGVLLPLVLPANQSTRIIAWVGSAASLTLCAIGVEGLAAHATFEVSLWTIPNLGPLTLALDHLSGLFLLVTGLVVLATAIYSRQYLERYSGDFSLRAFVVAFHSLIASVAIVLMAGDVVLFLIGWEAMSILAFLTGELPKARPGGSGRRVSNADLERGRICGRYHRLSAPRQSFRWTHIRGAPRCGSTGGHRAALGGLSAFIFRLRRKGGARAL